MRFEMRNVMALIAALAWITLVGCAALSSGGGSDDRWPYPGWDQNGGAPWEK